MYNLKIVTAILNSSFLNEHQPSPCDRIYRQEERSAQDLSLPQVWRVVLVHLEVVLGRDARRHPARQGPLLVDGHLLTLHGIVHRVETCNFIRRRASLLTESKRLGTQPACAT